LRYVGNNIHALEQIDPSLSEFEINPTAEAQRSAGLIGGNRKPDPARVENLNYPRQFSIERIPAFKGEIPTDLESIRTQSDADYRIEGQVRAVEKPNLEQRKQETAPWMLWLM